jgi:hypothetical protein
MIHLNSLSCNRKKEIPWRFVADFNSLKQFVFMLFKDSEFLIRKLLEHRFIFVACREVCVSIELDVAGSLLEKFRSFLHELWCVEEIVNHFIESSWVNCWKRIPEEYCE